MTSKWEQVGATKTFLTEVRNIGERRIRKPPNKLDDECYLPNDMTVDINEPINFDEEFSGEYSTQ